MTRMPFLGVKVLCVTLNSTLSRGSVCSAASSVYVGAFKASLSVTPVLDAGGWMSQRGKGREEK